MDLVVKVLSETDVSYQQVTDLLHDAFEERSEQGLHFTCSAMTAKEFASKTESGVIFVALDEKNEELLGTATIHIDVDKKGEPFGYMEYLAVRPSAKHTGVGTRLAQSFSDSLTANGAKYVLSDTACRATSSVNWHLKNGFQIYELVSYPSTDYWSYVFIKYLDGARKKSPLQIKWHYCLSVLYFKTLRNRDGSDTALGRLYKKTKSICRSFR